MTSLAHRENFAVPEMVPSIALSSIATANGQEKRLESIN